MKCESKWTLNLGDMRGVTPFDPFEPQPPPLPSRPAAARRLAFAPSAARQVKTRPRGTRTRSNACRPARAGDGDDPPPHQAGPSRRSAAASLAEWGLP